MILSFLYREYSAKYFAAEYSLYIRCLSFFSLEIVLYIFMMLNRYLHRPGRDRMESDIIAGGWL